jgi:hypothetical protein
MAVSCNQYRLNRLYQQRHLTSRQMRKPLTKPPTTTMLRDEQLKILS